MHDQNHATTYIVSGAVLEKDGKYLLVQEKQPKAYGLWNLPAGKVDEGETLEQAAIREVKEETGFEVELGRHLLVRHEATGKPVLHAFASRIVGGELHFPPEELLDAQWFTYQEISAMKDKLRNADYILISIEAARE